MLGSDHPRISHGPKCLCVCFALCSDPAVHQCPVRRILCTYQLLAGYGRGQGLSHHQFEPSRADLYSGTVPFTGGSRRQRPCVGAAAGRCVVHYLGGDPVRDHNKANDAETDRNRRHHFMTAALPAQMKAFRPGGCFHRRGAVLWLDNLNSNKRNLTGGSPSPSG